MKIIVKFNLVFIVVFLIGLAAAATVSHQLLQRNAREEIVQNARLLMETALATRAYTSTQVGPLLQTQMKYSFLPQSVPAYSATEVFNGVRKTFPHYDYKEATINPTNPQNRANDWEADIVKQFRARDLTELVGERDTPTGRSFYIAHPIEIKAQSCLNCHSTVAAAPRTLVDRYGPANGFGWKMNEVIGAQIVSVPTEVPIARANAAFRTFMGSLTLVFGLVFVALNLMLWHMVIRPVTRLSKLADQLSQGECMDAPDLEVKSGDEIGVLTQSFNRMKKSLVQVMQMLETSARPA
jgi:protein-histidine pros-kinase